LSSTVRHLASELAAALIRVLARAVGGLARACAMLGIAIPAGACQNDADVAPATPIEIDPRAWTDAPKAEPGPVDLGEFQLTFYYMATEAEVDSRKKHESGHVQPILTEDGGSAETVLSAVEPATVPIINGRDCSVLADVSPGFASELRVQGSGRLRDGRVLNAYGPCNCETKCFHVVGTKWGRAGNGRSLSPFRTVAVDPKVVKLGTLLYIQELDGMLMPGRPPLGGWRHDGCVSADDTGGGIDNKQLDLFVAKRSFYKGLARRGGSHSWAKRVHVFDGTGRCERKNGRVGKSPTAPTVGM
jgi:3D (Asp-Asp-Asp) domain-containing protein